VCVKIARSPPPLLFTPFNNIADGDSKSIVYVREIVYRRGLGDGLPRGILVPDRDEYAISTFVNTMTTCTIFPEHCTMF